MPPIITAWNKKGELYEFTAGHVTFSPDQTIVAITGHRPGKLGGDYDLTSPLVKRIELRLEGLIRILKPDFMISGMALGIDTLWAQLAMQYNIPLIAAIPFTDQDCKWPNRSRSLYHSLLKKAYAIVNVSGRPFYNPEYMQIRNEWMVDHCTKLIGVWDGSPGGTSNCLAYAMRWKREEDITIINPQFISV